MVTFASVEEQLKTIGCNFRFWGRSELKELSEILLPGEKIAQVVNGQYEAGFAMLCATDMRVLLIDKKPKYLSLKDIRFDMITELDFSNRILNSTVRIYTPNRELRFTTWNAARLRKLFTHTQHKVMEIRHRFMMQQFQVPGTGGMGNLPVGVMEAMEPLPPQPEPAGLLPDLTDEHKQMAAAVGAVGIHGARGQDGQVTAEYTTIPFSQRWRKRPYGYTNQPIYRPQTQQ